MEYGRYPAAGPPVADGGYGLDLVPDMVKQFVVYFYRHIRERNIREIYSMYEVSFVRLSEKFFKGSTWPPVELISELVDHDHVFCLLYKEMYFRHLYATTQPTLDQRCESWLNYTALFGVILHGNVNMQLPNGWLWDMIDEFIYQFQSFAQYRGKLAQKSAQELDMLKKCDDFWNVLGVLNYLQALVDKSGIVAELQAEGGVQRLFATDGYDPHSSNVLRMLGYFSLVGLCRVHALIGDYHGALRAIAPLNLFQTQDLFTPKIAGAHITLYYYGGFCYLMLRRYLDAARAFNTILSYIARVKQFHQRSAQYDQILKKNEQMFALLAITVSLCPTNQRTLDEATAALLREKYGEKIHKMVRGDDAVYDELFSYACPKFITAALPNYDAPGANTNQEAYRLQLKLFLGLLHDQRHLPTLKQFLKLYTSISLPKLAGLMDMNEDTLRSQLMLLKSAGIVKTWAGTGDATAGEFMPAGDLEFYIDLDPASGAHMVNVLEVKPQRRQDEFLINDIVKFDRIVADLSGSAALPAPAQMSALPAY